MSIFKIIAEEETKLGRKLNDNEKLNILNSFMSETENNESDSDLSHKLRSIYDVTKVVYDNDVEIANLKDILKHWLNNVNSFEIIKYQDIDKTQGFLRVKQGANSNIVLPMDSVISYMLTYGGYLTATDFVLGLVVKSYDEKTKTGKLCICRFEDKIEYAKYINAISLIL